MATVVAPPRVRRLTPPASVAGQIAVAPVVAAVPLALAIGLSHLHHTVSAVALVIVVIGSLWLFTTRHHLLALAVVMVYLGALDGYLKLASGSSVVTLVRDVMLYALTVGELARRTIQGRPLTLPPLSGWVLAFVAAVLVQVANPHGGTVVHSLAGVRQHLEYVPLFFLCFLWLRTPRALRTFLVLMALLSAANGIADLVQFNETPQQLASWGPGYADRVLGQGRFDLAGRTFAASDHQNRTRPFGLGSDSGAGGIVSAFAVPSIIALMALAVAARRTRWLVFASVMAILAVAGVVTSQARSVVLCAFFAAFAYGVLTATSRRSVVSLFAVGVATILTVVIVSSVVGSTTGASSLRYQGLDPVQFSGTLEKARGRGISAIIPNIERYPLGAGLATAGPASGTVGGGTALTDTIDTESEFSFLDVETGLPGLLILTGYVVMLIVLALRRLRTVAEREVQILLAAITAPLFGVIALWLTSALTPTIPSGPYLWAVGGVLSYWLIARPLEPGRAGASLAAPAGPGSADARPAARHIAAPKLRAN